MGNIIKESIDRRLTNLVCKEEQFNYIIEHCEEEPKEHRFTKWSNRKKLIIILAATIGIFSLLGAGIYYEYKTYRFNGIADQDTLKYEIDKLSRTLLEYNSSSMKTSVTVSVPAELASDKEDSWRTVNLQFLENEARSTRSPYHLKSLETVKKILEGSKNKLLYPAYLPEGYSFTEAYLNTYISPDMMLLEPIQSDLSDGVITETYVMPDSIIQNIESICIRYENEKGNQLEYNAHLSGSDNNGFGASGDATAKTISEAGFEKSILIYEPDIETYGHSIIGYFLSPTETIDYVFSTGLGLEYRYHNYNNTTTNKEVANMGLEQAINTYIDQYRYVLYHISGDSLSEDELIKIARSLK